MVQHPARFTVASALRRDQGLLRVAPLSRRKQRLLSTGRSASDHLSDELHEANLLLSDLVDDDDRESEDFKDDLEELRGAYARVVDAFETAQSVGSEEDQQAVRKNFELAVVGLRDKLSALEDEVA